LEYYLILFKTVLPIFPNLLNFNINRASILFININLMAQKMIIQILIKLLLTTLIVSQSTKKYRIDLTNMSASGLSAGGYMATQMHFAHSNYIKKVAVFAAGPYYCTEANLTKIASCMAYPSLINLTDIENKVGNFSANNLIDDVNYIKNAKVFLYSGKSDTSVVPGVVQKLEQMYKDFQANVTTKYDISGEHGFPTENYEKCLWN